MSRKENLHYRETVVSPGSDLYAALEDSNNSNLPKPERDAAAKKARAIYDRCMAEYRKYFKETA